MTDQEKLLATFDELGIEYEVKDFSERNPDGTQVVEPHLGGYDGFMAWFGFDPDGKFNLDKSGVWE